MATAATIKKNIAKLEAALKSKATPKTLKPKLEAQLVKSKAELSGIKKGTKPKTSSTKSTQTALQKLKEMVNKNKKFKTYKGAGVDLEKDADRPALRTGKRIAKESGKTYYEYRANRIDVKQPPKKYPKLEKGGYMAKGGKIKVKVGDKVKTKTSLSEAEVYEVSMDGYEFKLKDRYGNKSNKIYYTSDFSNSEIKPMAKGGMFEKPIPAIMDKYGNVKSEKQLEQDLEYLKEAYEDKLVTKDEYEKSYNEIKEQIKFLQKKENGGYMADGGYVAVSETKDGYWVVISRPTTKESAEEMADSLREDNRKVLNEETKVVTLEEAKAHKKIIGKEYLEKGGYMAKGGKVGMAEWAVTITSEDGESYDWDGFAKSEDDALDKAEKEAGFGSVESSVVMITDENGEKIEYAKGGVVGEYKVVPNKRGEGKLRMYVTSDYEMAFTISGSKEEAEKAAQNFVKEHNETHPTATVTKIHPSGQPIKNKNVSYVTKDEISKFEDGGMMNEPKYDSAGFSREDDKRIKIYSGNKGKLNEIFNEYKNQKNELRANEVFDNEKMKGKSVFLFVNDDFYDQYVQDEDEESYADENFGFAKGGYMADGGVTEKEVVDSNAQMVLSQIKAVKHHAQELSNVVSKNSDIEAWVVAKIERASTDLSDITHYLEFQTKKMAMGGEIHRTQQ